MNKKIIALVLVLIAFFAIAPKVAGLRFKQKIASIVANLNAAPGYEVKEVDLQQSWFGSSGTLNIQFTLPKSATQQQKNIELPNSIQAMIDIKAQFGPIIFGPNGGLNWASWQITFNGDKLRQYLNWSKDTPLYQISGHTNLLGNNIYHDQLQGFTLHKADENKSLTVAPYQGYGEISGDQIRYHGSGAATHFSIQDTGMDVQTSGLDVNANIHGNMEQLMRGGLYNGDASIVMASGQIHNGKANKQASIKNFKLATQSRLNSSNHTGNIIMGYSADEVVFDNYKTQDVAIEMAVNNLDSGFIHDYQKFSQSLQQQTPQQIPQAMQTFMRNSLLPLLKQSPQVNLTKIHAKLPEGIIDGHIDASVVNVDKLPDDLQDKNFWLSHLLVDGNLTVDEKLLTLVAKKFTLQQLAKNPNAARLSPEQLQQIADNQAPNMINNLVQNGMLVKQADQLTSLVHIANGTATINKLTVPLVH